MRKPYFGVFIFTLFLSQPSFSQILNPIKWTWEAVQTGKGEYKLVFKAKIEPKWHTYSQYIGDGGPVPSSFKFEKNDAVQLIGKTSETGTKVYEGHDVVFDMQLKYFENDMVCEQKVKITKDTKVKGTLEFMACDGSKCLPPDDKNFEFDLKVNPVKSTQTDKGKH